MKNIVLTYVLIFRSFSAHSARIIQMKSLNDKMNRVFITSSLDKTIKVTFYEIKIIISILAYTLFLNNFILLKLNLNLFNRIYAFG